MKITPYGKLVIFLAAIALGIEITRVVVYLHFIKKFW